MFTAKWQGTTNVAAKKLKDTNQMAEFLKEVTLLQSVFASSVLIIRC
jgi:hypothetical protein